MTFDQLTQLVSTVNEKYNLIIANAKTIAEFEEQVELLTNSFVAINVGGVTKKMQIQSILNAIEQYSLNQILNIGEITVAGNDITIPSGCQWRISGIIYFTSVDTVINIPFATTGNTRIDIIVATASGTLIKITGLETLDIAVRPNIPLNSVLVTEITVTDTSFDTVVYPLTTDETAAIQGANTPSASNVFATMADLPTALTPINLRVQYNGTSVTVPTGFTITRIISLNDINTEFAGVVTGTDLVITDGVANDIYLIDGY